MSDRSPDDFGAWGPALAFHLVARVLGGILMIPAAAVVAGIAHIVARDWVGLAIGGTLSAVVVIPLGEPVLQTLGAWFVIGRGDGRGQVLTDRQLRSLIYPSAIIVGAGWYLLVSQERGRGALLGAAVGLGFAGIVDVLVRIASRREAMKSQEEKDERDAALRDLARRSATEIKADREEQRFQFAERRRRKRRERMRRRGS